MIWTNKRQIYPTTKDGTTQMKRLERNTTSNLETKQDNKSGGSKTKDCSRALKTKPNSKPTLQTYDCNRTLETKHNSKPIPKPKIEK